MPRIVAVEGEPKKPTLPLKDRNYLDMRSAHAQIAL